LSEERAVYNGEAFVVSEPRQILEALGKYYAIIPETLIQSKNHSAIILYAVLYRTCYQGRGYIGAQTLAEKAGMSTATVQRAKKWLIANGFIEETFRGRGYRASEFNIPFQGVTRGLVKDAPEVSTRMRESHTNREVLTERSSSGPSEDCKSSSLPTEDTPSSKKPKRKTEIDDDFRYRMLVRYDLLIDVDDEIEKAVAHKQYTKYDGKQRYVETWLKRAVSYKSSAPGKKPDDPVGYKDHPFAKY